MLLALGLRWGTEDGRPVDSYLVSGLIGYAVANTAPRRPRDHTRDPARVRILKRPPADAAALVAHLATVPALNLIPRPQAVSVIALGVLLGADLPADALSFVLALLLGAVRSRGSAAAASLIRSAEAVAAVVNVIVLPMSFLSGAFGETDNLPRVLELVASVLPLKYLIELVLETYVDGDAFWENWTAIGVLAAWGIGGYLVARSRFGWEPRER